MDMCVKYFGEGVILPLLKDKQEAQLLVVGRTMWTQSTSVTDRQTDRQTDGQTELR